MLEIGTVVDLVNMRNLRPMCYRTYNISTTCLAHKNRSSHSNKEREGREMLFPNRFKYSDRMRTVTPQIASNRINGVTENFTNVDINGDLLQLEKSYKLQGNIKKGRLSDKSKSNLQGEIIYGVHPVHLALLSKRRSMFQLYVYKKLLKSPECLKGRICQQAIDLGIPIKEVSRSFLSQISEGHVHQGVCLEASKLKMYDVEENFAENTVTEDNSFCLLLDKIQDPMNFGAVLRSSYYFGVNKVFAVKESSCKLSPVVSKASSGAMEILPIYSINDLLAFLKSKKEKRWKIIGSDSYSVVSDSKYMRIDEVELTEPTIFILGNEGTGMSKIVYDLCDRIVTINPKENLHPEIGSLNVSVVCGIVLHQLLGKK